jgi:1,4-alpha-glucan branching enzyme
MLAMYHPGFRASILTVAGILALTKLAPAQSSRPGMGSTPYADASGTGVTFRVWAPDATSVSVPGIFNGWNTTANFLVNEGSSGLWSADIPAARPNNEYKYFISPVVSGSGWKMDPRSRKVVNSTGNSIVYDPNAFNWSGDTRLPVDGSSTVIYEMHVGAFYDPSPASAGPGKFTDAITKLDYLASLGVNAVELLPIAEFPGDYSWGYNLSDPYAVENSGYGGPDGLKSFVKAAHQRGIRVIMDVVHNHYGPTDLDMWGFDVGSTPGIYFYSASGIANTPWGPRPNYSSEGVRSYIIDNFRMWMDECHVDGFRWDAVGAMRHYDPGYVSIPEADSLIQYINSTIIHSDHPGAISIAEDDSDSMDFDSQWGVSVGDEIINEMVQPLDSSRDMNALKSAMDGNGFSRVLYTETHDLVGALNGSGAQRLPVRIQPANATSYFARKRSMLAAAIVMSSPGIPMLFMGQEMLTTNQFDANIPLDWSRVNTYSNVVSFYRDIIRLRRNLDGASWGFTGPNVSWHAVDNTSKLLAFHRWGAGPNDQVMVVINCSNVQLNNYQINGFPVNGTWYVNLNSDWKKYGADFGDVGSVLVQVSGNSGSVTIAPYSVLILSLDALPSLNPAIKFTNIQFASDNVGLTWTGGQVAQQILEQATDLSGPWTPVFTNQPPTPITNSISIPSSAANSDYFRIRQGP